MRGEIPCSEQQYLDVSVHYFFGVAEIKRVGDGEDDFCDLGFVGTAVEVAGRIEFSPFAILHDDVEEAGVVVDFVDFDDVGMFQLIGGAGTKSKISH